MICALIGFAGVIVAMQGAPSEAESPQHDLGVIAVLVSAAFFSIAMVLLRERSQKDGAVDRRADDQRRARRDPDCADRSCSRRRPCWSDWSFFLLMGALAAVFMYLMAQAYARAEAQQLAPIHYTELI